MDQKRHEEFLRRAEHRRLRAIAREARRQRKAPPGATTPVPMVNPFGPSTAPPNPTSSRQARRDRIVRSIATDINRLPSLKARLNDLEASGCRGCKSLTISFLKGQVREIEGRLAGQGSRMLRWGKEQAERMRAPAKA